LERLPALSDRAQLRVVALANDRPPVSLDELTIDEPPELFLPDRPVQPGQRQRLVNRGRGLQDRAEAVPGRLFHKEPSFKFVCHVVIHLSYSGLVYNTRCAYVKPTQIRPMRSGLRHLTLRKQCV